ncbi:MAG: cell division protein FtsQ/DivIB [Nevskiales bacterium]
MTRPAVDGFWDRPPLLNLVADLLLLFGTLALAYAALTLALRLPVFPLKQVVVASALDQVTVTQIEYAAQSSLAGNFFTVNLDQVRAAFEKLPWVRKASVRRRWPDGIELAIEEHVAVARWQNSSGETRLVNNRGEVFAAALPAGQSSLPLFGGPEGSAPLMLERFHEFNSLLAPLGRSLRVVGLSPREAWQLRLDDGLMLELGRDQTNYPIHDRLQRFVGIYNEAKARSAGSIAAIDMRYPNGFALRSGHGEALHAADGPRSKGTT